jgi:hypothetical protein
LSDRDAEVIFGQLHYLRSTRRDAENWALFDGSTIVAAAALSPCDLTHLRPLPRSVQVDEVVVLSRVYAFSSAPKNTLSFFFGHLAKRAASQLKRLMISYVNPNLGFTGASYRAANWSLLYREHGTRYQYIDGKYVTDRKLVSDFGTSKPDLIRGLAGNRYEAVTEGLAPLSIFGYFVDQEDRNLLIDVNVLDVRRPD